MRKLWKKFLDKLLDYRWGQLVSLIGYDIVNVVRYRWGQYKEVLVFDSGGDWREQLQAVIEEALKRMKVLDAHVASEEAQYIRTDHGSMAELIETLNAGGTKH